MIFPQSKSMFAFNDRHRIIDAHHHFWIYDPKEYCWIDDSKNILKRNYLTEDLRPELQVAGVKETVVVQARQSLEETRWLLTLADQNTWIKGIVGWVDLRSENIAAQLNEFVTHTKFRGVRHVIHDEPDIDFMLGYEFKRGIQTLSHYDLTYDLLLFPKHLKNAVRLVKNFPGQKFILDHISKPSIKSGDINRWKKDIFKLAGLPNIYCKISGMVTEADLSEWKYDDFIPYLDVVVEAFGTNRLMIGSDWPVCLLAGGYSEIMKIPETYFASFSESDQEKVFYRNCMNIYGLK